MGAFECTLFSGLPGNTVLAILFANCKKKKLEICKAEGNRKE
jgi:hypothetical protein